MTRIPLMLTLVAAAALAGCNKDDTANTAVAAENNLAEAAPVVLPPSITASKIYRCKDNSILYVDWLSDNKSANVRTEKSGTPTQVDTSAEGATLKGSATAPSITFNGKSCKA